MSSHSPNPYSIPDTPRITTKIKLAFPIPRRTKCAVPKHAHLPEGSKETYPPWYCRNPGLLIRALKHIHPVSCPTDLRSITTALEIAVRGGSKGGAGRVSVAAVAFAAKFKADEGEASAVVGFERLVVTFEDKN